MSLRLRGMKRLIEMRALKLPGWFRVVLVVVFLALTTGVVLVSNDGVRQAMATPLLERMVREYLPAMEQSLALPRRRPEPADGAYYMNGMLVEYHTIPAPVGAAETMRRLDAAFHKTGYATRLLPVRGRATLVAIHPKTKMLLTARPGRDGAGAPTVRLSQQDLSKLNSSFRAEIPELPAFPGARNPVLLTSADGPRSASLTFVVNDSADGAADYYTKELAARGWHHLVPPGGSPLSAVKALFFERNGDESYFVAGPGPQVGETLVMITLTEQGRS
jgi:hypothetical protein